MGAPACGEGVGGTPFPSGLEDRVSRMGSLQGLHCEVQAHPWVGQGPGPPDCVTGKDPSQSGIVNGKGKILGSASRGKPLRLQDGGGCLLGVASNESRIIPQCQSLERKMGPCASYAHTR